MEAKREHGVYVPFVKCAMRLSHKLVVASLGNDEQLGQCTAGVNEYYYKRTASAVSDSDYLGGLGVQWQGTVRMFAYPRRL